MRRLAGLLFVLALGAFASCSDGGDDTAVRACKVIVQTCKKGDSVGNCLDDLGPRGSDCLGCIAAHGCDYATCQSDVPGCRLPGYMLDPSDRIETGPRPPDGGSADSGAPDAEPTG